MLITTDLNVVIFSQHYTKFSNKVTKFKSFFWIYCVAIQIEHNVRFGSAIQYTVNPNV